MRDRERFKQILGSNKRWVLEEVLNYLTQPVCGLEFFKRLEQVATAYWLKLIDTCFVSLPILEARPKTLDTALRYVRCMVALIIEAMEREGCLRPGIMGIRREKPKLHQ